MQWSKAILGLSFSVANGVLYVGSGDGNVYALNAGTGEKLWSYATDGQVSAAPTVADGKVFIGSSNGNIYVLGLPPVAEEQASAADHANQ
jgi:outer membrane protein assembly factor BamB